MERMPFVFTILFLLLGPIKLIAAFAQLTRHVELRVKRVAALRGVLVASAICAFVAFMGRGLVTKYELSVASLAIAGGLLLVLSALKSIFPEPTPLEPPAVQPDAMQFAISPLATPVIVTPMGVAALLIFIMWAGRFPGIEQAIALSLIIIMVLNFLVMFFIDRIVRVPGLLAILQLSGSVLIFIQLALGVETILGGLASLKLLDRF